MWHDLQQVNFSWFAPLYALPIVMGVLAVGLWLGRRHFVRRWTIGSAAVRTIIFALIALAVCEPNIVRPVAPARPTLVILQDVSNSTLSDPAAAASVEAIRQAAGNSINVQTIRFAEEPSTQLGREGSANITDIGRALRFAGARFQLGSGDSIVLVSDGRSTAGDASSAAGSIAFRGVTINALPVGIASEQSSPAVLRVDPPLGAKVGQPTSVRVLVDPGKPGRNQVRLRRKSDGKVVAAVTADLTGRSSTTLRFTPETPDLNQFEVELVPLAANETEPTRQPVAVAGTAIDVLGPPRILLVDPFPSDMASFVNALKPLKQPVDAVTPASMPADLSRYSAIVVSDVAGDELSTHDADRLQSFVEKSRGGVVFIGGSNVVASRWRASPLASLLPVELIDPPKKPAPVDPPISVVFVLDRSGSMADPNEALFNHDGKAFSKWELLLGAVGGCISILPPSATVTIVTFADDVNVIADRVSLKPPDAKDRLQDSLRGIGVKGATHIASGLEQGLGILRESPGQKHIVVLTDGQDTSKPPVPESQWRGLARQSLALHATWTSIALGRDADVSLMDFLAAEAQGTSEHVTTAEPLEVVFRQIANDAKAKAEKPDETISLIDGPDFTSIEQLPPATKLSKLEGKLLFKPKENSRTIYNTSEQKPALSMWNVGLGKVAAFASDAKRNWARSWVEQNVYSDFWAKVVQSVQRDVHDVHTDVTVNSSLGRVAYTFNISDVDEKPVSDLAVAVDYDPPLSAASEAAGPAHEIEGLGHGNYRVTFDPDRITGPVDAHVRLSNAGQNIDYRVHLDRKAPAAEAALGPDLASLSALTQASGGIVSSDPASLARHARPPAEPVRRVIELWPFVLLLAALLWPLDVWMRRNG